MRQLLLRRTPSPASRAAPDATAALPCVPKSSLVSTMPRPKNCSHARLTATRAVSGFSSSTSQRARPRRFGIWSSRQRMESRRHAGVDLLALVQEAAAAAHERGGPLVAGPLAHHERGRDAEGPELLLQLRDPIARRLQRHRDGPVEGGEILALLLGPLGRGDCQNRPQPGRDLHDALRRAARRDRQPEAAERLSDDRALVLQADPQPASRRRRRFDVRRGNGIVQRLLEREHDLPRQPLLLTARVDPPSSRGVGVARQALRKERVDARAAVVGLVGANRLERRSGARRRRPTSNPFIWKLPYRSRPGPPFGSDGSGSASRRIAVTRGSEVDGLDGVDRLARVGARRQHRAVGARPAGPRRRPPRGSPASAPCHAVDGSSRIVRSHAACARVERRRLGLAARRSADRSRPGSSSAVASCSGVGTSIAGSMYFVPSPSCAHFVVAVLEERHHPVVVLLA